jgi:hypothetical protein
MRLLATLATSVLMLVTASAASAQGVSEIFVTTGGRDSFSLKDLLSQVTVPVDVSGGVAVEYHGSTAAGCAAIGVCDVAGSVTWNPGTQATLSVTRYVSHGKRKLSGLLGFYGSGNPSSTTALVTRGGGHLCSDVLDGGSSAGASAPSNAALQLRLVSPMQPDFLTSRCAGPLQSDLLGLLPVRPLPRSVLHGATRSMDLSTVRPFSSGGFSGTLRSTIRLRVGPRSKRRSLQDFPKLIHFRTVDVSYRVTKVSGSLAFAFRGDPRLCADLDACTSSGTVSVSEDRARGDFAIEVLADRKRPWADLLAALQLSRHGNSRGIFARGSGFWTSRAGRLSASVAGAQSCRDAVPLGGGDLSAETRGKSLVLTYNVFAGNEAEHTHCAGPMLADAAVDYTLARGSVPLRALRRKTVTVHLTRKPGDHSAGAYVISGQGGLTVTLRRNTVRRSTVDF